MRVVKFKTDPSLISLWLELFRRSSQSFHHLPIRQSAISPKPNDWYVLRVVSSPPEITLSHQPSARVTHTAPTRFSPTLVLPDQFLAARGQSSIAVSVVDPCRRGLIVLVYAQEEESPATATTAATTATAVTATNSNRLEVQGFLSLRAGFSVTSWATTYSKMAPLPLPVAHLPPPLLLRALRVVPPPPVSECMTRLRGGDVVTRVTTSGCCCRAAAVL